MKKYISFTFLTVSCCLFFSSCNTATPEKYFDLAVLNSNMIVGFANDGLTRELEMPSMKMGNSKDEAIAMKRNEVVLSKIQFVDEALEKVKGLKETPDTKDILNASIKLYEFILPVYKNEYTQLAAMYDKNLPKDQIVSQVKMINDKYHEQFETFYSDLINKGKLYAARNGIKVNWAM